MSYTIKGKVFRVGSIQKRGVKQFEVRNLDLEFDQDGDWPQVCRFDLLGGNVGLADGISKGDVVEVNFDLRGREWKDEKVFNSLVIWKLEKVGEAESHPAPTVEIPEDDEVPF